jgi:trehalose 6-phosphate synthase
LVNPFDCEAVGAAIADALSMSRDERRTRHGALFEVLMARDVKSWGETFLTALAEPAAAVQSRLREAARTPPGRSQPVHVGSTATVN